jgi:hypothetical protein
MPFVNLIHGVDSLKLLLQETTNKQKNDRIIDCLLQMHILQKRKQIWPREEELIEILFS